MEPFTWLGGGAGAAIPSHPRPYLPAKQMDCKGYAFARGPGGKAPWRGSGAEPLAAAHLRPCPDPLPRHRPEGRQVRPPAARRHGPGDGLCRRPGRAGARLAGCRLRLAARGGPERRLRRPAGERRRGRAPSWPRCASRCSSAAASATWPASRPGSPPACAASSWAAPRSKTPHWCAPGLPRLPRPHRRRHRRARRLRGHRGLGGDLHADRRSTWRCAFEDAGVAAIIYTDIGRDGMLSGLNLAQTVELARQLATPVIASGGVGGLDDLAALARRSPAPGGRHRDRGCDRRPRAL